VGRHTVHHGCQAGYVVSGLLLIESPVLRMKATASRTVLLGCCLLTDL
jgi:hypothetical protein